MRVGLLGGSFNPAHGGHRHIALTALRRLRLDEVWFLVAAGNPLKDGGALAPFGERLASARSLIRDRRGLFAVDFEERAGLRYTADVTAALKTLRPRTQFVWLMGSDSLLTLHRWGRWRDIVDQVPIAVIARPGSVLAPVRAPAAKGLLRVFRRAETEAPAFPSQRPPAWIFLRGPLDPRSSTLMRQNDVAYETAGR